MGVAFSQISGLFVLLPLLQVAALGSILALSRWPGFGLNREQQVAAMFCGAHKTIAFGMPLLKVIRCPGCCVCRRRRFRPRSHFIPPPCPLHADDFRRKSLHGASLRALADLPPSPAGGWQCARAVAAAVCGGREEMRAHLRRTYFYAFFKSFPALFGGLLGPETLRGAARGVGAF